MIVIAEGELKELLMTGKSRKYKRITNNKDLYNGLRRVISFMLAAENTNDLQTASFLHYEKLKHDYYGLSSVRLSNRYVHRLIFLEENDKITLKLIEIDDTHYGNKK